MDDLTLRVVVAVIGLGSLIVMGIAALALLALWTLRPALRAWDEGER